MFTETNSTESPSLTVRPLSIPPDHLASQIVPVDYPTVLPRYTQDSSRSANVAVIVNGDVASFPAVLPAGLVYPFPTPSFSNVPATPLYRLIGLV